MAKVTMRAIKTFYNAGSFTVAGDTFEVEETTANAYIARDLAEYADGHTPNLTGATAGEKAYEDQTVSDLRKVAKEKNVTGYFKMSKEELIQAIRQAEGDQ